MINHPPFMRLLDANEYQRAGEIRADLTANIEFRPAREPKVKLDRARIIYEYGGLDSIDPEHLRALALAANAIGDHEAYLVMPGSEGATEQQYSWIERVAIDLPRMADFIDTHTEDDRLVLEPIADEWSSEVKNLLNPIFVGEWTILSPSAGWVFSTWDAGDISAMAGNNAFIDAYFDARPSAALDVVAWVIGDGEAFAGVHDQPGWFARMLGKRRPERVLFFEETSLQEYLVPFYGADTASEIWNISEQIRDMDDPQPLEESELPDLFGQVFESQGGGPDMLELLKGSMVISDAPDQRVAKLISAKPELESRLAEIWRG